MISVLIKYGVVYVSWIVTDNNVKKSIKDSSFLILTRNEEQFVVIDKMKLEYHSVDVAWYVLN